MCTSLAKATFIKKNLKPRLYSLCRQANLLHICQVEHRNVRFFLQTERFNIHQSEETWRCLFLIERKLEEQRICIQHYLKPIKVCHSSDFYIFSSDSFAICRVSQDFSLCSEVFCFLYFPSSNYPSVCVCVRLCASVYICVSVVTGVHIALL